MLFMGRSLQRGRCGNMGKKKYYAVAVGKRAGVYTTWPEAEKQVKGYPGARFKGFPTQKEAEAWIAGGQTAGQAVRKPVVKKAKKSNSSEPVIDPAKVTIFTDGGAINNPGPGGYGVVTIIDGKEQEYSGGFRMTTNNRMELMAVIVALTKLKVRNRPIILHSDSSYVVNGMSKGWAKKWQRNDWRKSDGKSAVNPDLWEKLLTLVAGLDIEFKWVKGHAGYTYNERCDQLAVGFSRKSGLPVDEGYLK
jgi:ribonuclease HI